MQTRKNRSRVFRLSFADSAEARARLVRTMKRQGLFVPTNEPEPLGAEFELQLMFHGGQLATAGRVQVMAHGTSGRTRGYFVKYVAVKPGGVELPVSPRVLAVPPPLPEEDKEESTLSGVIPVSLGGELPAGHPPAGHNPVTVSLPRGARASPPPPPPEARGKPPPPVEEMGQSVVELVSDEDVLLAHDPHAWEGGLRPFDTFGNYQLLKRLGAGGMAEVILARHQLSEGVDKLVALKLVFNEFAQHPTLSSLFLTEARVSATLQHPNLAQVFDVGEAAGRPFMAMEYVHGRNGSELLRQLRERGGPPPPSLGVALTIELCKALEYLHDKHDLDGRPLQLVHRDVSPSNLLISQHGVVKLLDMGVASASIADDSTSLMVGKRAYMSPEQAEGQTPEPSWDIYSAGLVLHELLTLERPFEGVTEASAFIASRRTRLRPSAFNRQVSEDLDAAVQWATEFDPRRRAPSARALRRALETVHATLPPLDLVRMMRELFGKELDELQHETEALISLARQRTSTHPSSAGRRLRSVVLRLVPGRVRLAAIRHRQLLRWGALALLLAGGGGGVAVGRAWRHEATLREQLARADQLIASAKLVGPGEDCALGQLKAARELAPTDARVLARLGSLADTFETLAQRAAAREDLAESMGHYRAALEADGGRTVLRVRIRALEDEMRFRAQSHRGAP